jgi:hypothetical protein
MEVNVSEMRKRRRPLWMTHLHLIAGCFFAILHMACRVEDATPPCSKTLAARLFFFAVAPGMEAKRFPGIT